MSRSRIPSDEIKNASVEELLRAFSPWIHFVARRFRDFTKRSGVIDEEDLYWVGADALVRARESFDPNAGVGFLHYSFFEIRSAMQQQLRLGARDFEPQLIYLDAPLPEDEDLALLDTIASDDKGPDEVAEDHDLRDHLQAAVERLGDPDQRETIKKRFYEDKTIDETAAALHTSPQKIRSYSNKALCRLRRDRQLRDAAFHYRHVGVCEFASTLTSEVELAVIDKEAMYDRLFGKGAFARAGKPSFRFGNHSPIEE